MDRTSILKPGHWALALLVVAALTLVSGCNPEATAETASSAPAYSGALDTSYEGALDAVSQLALGTLQLEGTADAVTQEEAAELLPLWNALGGSVLQGDAERFAVLRQIERTMTEAQASAIVAMRLTQGDVQSWAQNQGGRGFAGGDQAQGGGQRSGASSQGTSPDQIERMRQQFQNMSPEELATRRAQFSGQAPQGGVGRTRLATGSGTSTGLTRAVMALLAERSGARAGNRQPRAVEALTAAATTEVSPQASATPSPAPTATPESTPAAQEGGSLTSAPAPVPTPTSAAEAGPEPTPPTPVEPTKVPEVAPEPTSEPATYVVQRGNTLAAIAEAYGVTVESIAQANDIQDPNMIHVGQTLVIPNPARVPETVEVRLAPSAVAEGGAVAATEVLPSLEQVPDTDPGPPFTVEVSLNRTTPDPVVEKSRTYVITGIVRNDGDRTYAVSALHVTFFDASGFRGTFIKYPRVPGGEWVWHGRTKAELASLLLAPGEEWPFSVEITGQDMASFLIHPDAAPTERESVPVQLSQVKLTQDGTDYLRISGTATNVGSVKAKNVTVSGVLLNASGQIVSLGSTYVVQQDIEPGTAVHFDLRIAKASYTNYWLYAQAERDWD